jgi:hypothetical protein
MCKKDKAGGLLQSMVRYEHELLLANYAKENKPEPVIAKISQETLAEIVGITVLRSEHPLQQRPIYQQDAAEC